MKHTKSFSRLMRDISSNAHEKYYCFGCFHSFTCESTLEKHTQLCKDHSFCKIKLPDNDNKVREHKHGSKALRMNDIIYVDLECLLVNQDTCFNNPNKSHTTNIAQHIPSGYLIDVVRDHNNSSVVTYYREKYCIKKLCEELREIGIELLNTEKEEAQPVTSNQKKIHKNSKKCHICKKPFHHNKKSKYYNSFRKVKDHNYYNGIYRGAAHSTCKFKYTTKRDIHVVIHNGSNYDFHLRIKELAAESKKEIHCIPEDKQKYKSFSIPIMYKSAEKYEYPCNLIFIDSNKFMLGSLVSHVNNLYEMYSCNCSNESNQQN